jgi:hypothetical protein
MPANWGYILAAYGIAAAAFAWYLGRLKRGIAAARRALEASRGRAGGGR